MEEKSRPRQHEPGTWIEGGKEEDNERYRAFMQYCEERRQESRRKMRERRGEQKPGKNTWNC